MQEFLLGAHNAIGRARIELNPSHYILDRAMGAVRDAARQSYRTGRLDLYGTSRKGGFEITESMLSNPPNEDDNSDSPLYHHAMYHVDDTAEIVTAEVMSSSFIHSLGKGKQKHLQVVAEMLIYGTAHGKMIRPQSRNLPSISAEIQRICGVKETMSHRLLSQVRSAARTHFGFA